MGAYAGFSGADTGALQLIGSVTVGADTDTVTFPGLNGNLDGVYCIEGALKVGSGGVADIELRPNALTTNQILAVSTWDSAGTAAAAGGTVLKVGAVDVDGGAFSAWINAAAGLGHRLGGSSACSKTGSALSALDAAFVWADSTTKITSLVLHATVAASIGAGSRISLYRLVTA
jgi:hypothetical protein